MSDFLYVFSIIAPLFFLLVIGWTARKRGLFNDEIIGSVNRICYSIFIPINLFYSVYNSELPQTGSYRAVAYCAAATVVSCALGMLLLRVVAKDDAQRSGLIQSLFRTNMVMISLPIAAGIYGDDIGIFALTIALVIPLNIMLSVLSLEYYRKDKGRVNGWALLKKTLVNRLVVASVVGFVFLVAGWKLPVFAEKTVRYVSQATTALALILVGAAFDFRSAGRNRRLLAITVAARLLVLPVLFTAGAYLFGMRGGDLMLPLLLFSVPAATVAPVLVRQMGGDAELSTETVVFTTFLAPFTLFVLLLAARKLGLY